MKNSRGGANYFFDLSSEQQIKGRKLLSVSAKASSLQFAILPGRFTNPRTVKEMRTENATLNMGFSGCEFIFFSCTLPSPLKCNETVLELDLKTHTFNVTEASCEMPVPLAFALMRKKETCS